MFSHGVEPLGKVRFERKTILALQFKIAGAHSTCDQFRNLLYHIPTRTARYCRETYRVFMGV